MRYLHTMIRVKDLTNTMDFFCNKLGLIEINRMDNEVGRFTLVFLAAPDDMTMAKEIKAPLLELTYNWPDDNGHTEDYTSGRNFGHLAYQVDNIYETCAHLMAHGVTINRPPRDGYMAFIKSPDGISIELLQHGVALPVQEPWVSMENQGNW